MPRAGLTTERVVEAAAELADEIGFDLITVSALARGFGVKDASLYAHVRGLQDLRTRVATGSATAFADRIGAALAGRSGRDALAAFADAYRDFALRHPGRYAATQLRLPPETLAASRATPASSSSRTPSSSATTSPNRTAPTRSAWCAAPCRFTSLEAAGGFGHPRDPQASWGRAIEALHALLTRWPSAPPSATLAP